MSWPDRTEPGSPYAGRVAATDTYRELGEAAWSWVLGQVRGDDGPWLPETVPEDDATGGPGATTGTRSTSASAGLAPVLAEIAPAPGADRRGAGARARDRRPARRRRRPSAPSPPCTTGWPATRGAPAARPGQRDGRARAAGRADDPGRLEQPRPGRRRDRGAAERPGRRAPRASCWPRSGRAASRPRTIATTGGEALLRVADPTEAGLDWPMVRDWPSRMPNYSHGTAGVATALAVAGTGPGPPGLRRRRGAGRPAPARRGLAGRRRVRRAAHDPAVHPGRGAGDLDVVPRAGRHVVPVRGAGPRRASTRSTASTSPTCDSGASAPSSRPASRSGSAPASGTTTAAAAAPRASGDILLDAAQDATDPATGERAPRGRPHDG